MFLKNVGGVCNNNTQQQHNNKMNYTAYFFVNKIKIYELKAQENFIQIKFFF